MLRLFASPSIDVALESDQLFVHSIVPGIPSTDPVLRGTALLALPSKRLVKRVKVVLEGVTQAFGGEGTPYETSYPLQKELYVELNEVLEVGKHAFNFSFIVPSSTAVSQRSPYGRTRHYVKATADFDSVLGSSCASPSVVVWVTANPSAPGEIPEPTTLRFEHYSEDIGAVGVSVSSPFLTVAALLSIKLSLPGPPQPVTVISVDALIEQSFEVSYDNGEVVRPPPRLHKVSKVDPSAKGVPASKKGIQAHVDHLQTPAESRPVVDPLPLARLQPGQEYSYSTITRLPSDDFVRPSTLETIDTRIRVSHRLVVEIKYEKEVGKPISLKIAKPIQISSCCCLLDDLTLPSYSSAPPCTVTRRTQDFCFCHYETQMLVDKDGEALQRSGDLDSPTSPPRILGIDGREAEPANKTPAWAEGGGLGYIPRTPDSL